MLRQKGKRLSISSRLRLFLNILNSSMKSLLLITTLVIISGLFARAANAEQEKAFVEKYKTALEANDSATLQSVLYTKWRRPNDCRLLQNDAVERSGRQSFQDRPGGFDARRREKGDCAAGFPQRWESLPQP